MKRAAADPADRAAAGLPSGWELAVVRQTWPAGWEDAGMRGRGGRCGRGPAAGPVSCDHRAMRRPNGESALRRLDNLGGDRVAFHAFGPPGIPSGPVGPPGWNLRRGDNGLTDDAVMDLDFDIRGREPRAGGLRPRDLVTGNEARTSDDVVGVEPDIHVRSYEHGYGRPWVVRQVEAEAAYQGFCEPDEYLSIDDYAESSDANIDSFWAYWVATRSVVLDDMKFLWGDGHTDEDDETLAMAFAWMRYNLDLIRWTAQRWIGASGRRILVELIEELGFRILFNEYGLAFRAHWTFGGYLKVPTHPDSRWWNGYRAKIRLSGSELYSAENAFVVMDLAATLLHELVHVAGDYASDDVSREEIAQSCFSSYLIENDFRWACLCMYEELRSCPCGLERSYSDTASVADLYSKNVAVYLVDSCSAP